MKIYTRIGDQGYTFLGNGQKVLKSALRIHTYGMVDELNSWIGLIIAQTSAPVIPEMLKAIQNDLFEIGADLATPEDDELQNSTAKRIPENKVDQLEKWIDQLEEILPPLHNFIIPGGTLPASTSHIARCVCRRAERDIVELMQQEKINPIIIKYLNRLSDLLFTIARFLNQHSNTQETLWPNNPA